MANEEEEALPSSEPKRVRRTYNEWSEEELKEELKVRKFKVGRKRKREEIVKLLEEDDRGQRRISWWRSDVGEARVKCDQLRGEGNGGGGEGDDTMPPPVSEGGDPEWVDIIPEAGEAIDWVAQQLKDAFA